MRRIVSVFGPLVGCCVLSMMPHAANAELPAVIKGSVFSCSTGAPLANMRVDVVSANETRTVKTNADGRYTAVGLPSGSYHVLVPLSFNELSVNQIAVSDGDVARVDVGVRPERGHRCGAIARIEPPTTDRYNLR
jgi:hypothetical protein